MKGGKDVTTERNHVWTSDESVQDMLTHDKDKKHVPIWNLSEVLTGIIHELSNASWSECDDECGWADIEEYNEPYHRLETIVGQHENTKIQ